MKIAPSILAANFGNIIEDIKKVEKAGVELLHIDVMDGHFVPNITIGPSVIKSLKGRVNIPFDVHLMIENPDIYLADFVNSGADIITVHQEACIHLHRTIQKIKNYGIKASVALNPATSVETLKYILGDIDMVLVMTVNPGFGGQKFISSMLDKIKELDLLRKKLSLNFEIEVDGGITTDNIFEIYSSGADIVVAGSAIFGSDNPLEIIHQFRKAVQK